MRSLTGLIVILTVWTVAGLAIAWFVWRGFSAGS
jgi:hypothetical protein